MPKQKPEQMPEGFRGWALIDGERGSVTLKDVLRNLSAAENGTEHEYAKGALVGVVTTLCACGMDYTDACQLVWQHLPTDCHFRRFPNGWIDEFEAKMLKSTIPTK